jgi:N-hydroxyarylamine O-acetyltransferase
VIDRDAVLARLGLATTMPSLDALYRAWCLVVPFDNIRKVAHLRTGAAGPLPGATPDDFFAAFLADGVGATCWPISGALVWLLRACGFDAWRIAGTMRDDVIPEDSPTRPNHGGVVASVDGADLLVDPSIMSEEPLLLFNQPTETPDPLVGADAEPLADGGWRVTFAPWRPDGRLPCRFDPSRVTDEFCAARYEYSRSDSPFNTDLYVRRNSADRVQILTGPEYWVMPRPGQATVEKVGDRRSLTEILVDDFGIAESAAAAVDQ